MFTYILITLASLAVIAVVVHEIRSWRRPGHHISQNAPMDSQANNNARSIHDSSFGPIGGGTS